MTLALVVSMTADSPDTVTVSDSDATFSATSTGVVWPTCTTTLWRSVAWNPDSSSLTEYVPVSSDGKR